MKNIFQKVLTTVFPNHYKCITCGKEIDYAGFDFCENCIKNLPQINGKICLRCGEPIKSMANYCLNCKNNKHHFKRNLSAFTYEKPISDHIMNLKYNNKKYLGEIFTAFLVQKYLELNISADVVIPIPLHPNRLKERGYNQAEIIAKPLSEKLNIPLALNAIERVRDTPKQSLSKSFEDRALNIKDAFKVISKNEVKDKVVLLIDDVYTTGSTLSECAKVLLKAKAKEVYCLTVAHAKQEN